VVDDSKVLLSAALKFEGKCEIVRWLEELAPWDVYFTGTFKWPRVSQDWAAKVTESFMARFQPRVPVFYAVERNPGLCDQGNHVHAILATTKGCYRKQMWHGWFSRFGVARVLPITAVGGVAGYCAKYVLKRPVWWNVLNGVQGAL